MMEYSPQTSLIDYSAKSPIGILKQTIAASHSLSAMMINGLPCQKYHIVLVENLSGSYGFQKTEIWLQSDAAVSGSHWKVNVLRAQQLSVKGQRELILTVVLTIHWGFGTCRPLCSQHGVLCLYTVWLPSPSFWQAWAIWCFARQHGNEPGNDVEFSFGKWNAERSRAHGETMPNV